MARVLESNGIAAGSFWRYDIRTTTGGGTSVTFTSRRFGKTAKTRLLIALTELKKDLEETLRRVAESRDRHSAAKRRIA